MKTRHKQILTYLFLFATLNVFGQADSINYSDFDRNHIDSLTAIIDKHNPTKVKLAFITSLDSLVGEQVMTIDKQNLKNLCK